MSTTITEFLEARIAEDEATAAEYQHYEDQVYETAGWFNPSRVLRECAAKRALIAQVSDVAWGGYAVRDVVLETLAAVYSDHPDYQSGWAL